MSREIMCVCESQIRKNESFIINCLHVSMYIMHLFAFFSEDIIYRYRFISYLNWHRDYTHTCMNTFKCIRKKWLILHLCCYVRYTCGHSAWQECVFCTIDKYALCSLGCACFSVMKLLNIQEEIKLLKRYAFLIDKVWKLAVYLAWSIQQSCSNLHIIYWKFLIL